MCHNALSLFPTPLCLERQTRRSASSEHFVSWDSKDFKGVDVGSGVCFYQLKVGDHTETKKLVLIR